MVKIENISKTFYRKGVPFKALDDVSLEIEEGQIVGIIGSSGAGKSTLIRCVNLLEKPDSGKVLIDGIDLTSLPSKKLATERKKIGMIFQHFNLLSSRTVFENIALPLELDKVDKGKIEKRVSELLQLVDLEEKRDEYPKNLSGGQKQRVAIARALANEPHLLLCDEATSALDPSTTLSILRLLRDINNRLNITILLITHEMDVVKTICDNIAVIDQGKVVANGTLEELLTKNSHPILRKFMQTNSLGLPQELHKKLRKTQEKGLYPVIELEFNGTMAVDELLSYIQKNETTAFSTIKSNMETIGNRSYGKLILHVKAEQGKFDVIASYLNNNQININLRGYA